MDNINLELNKQELEVLVGLLDAAVKALGLPAVGAVHHLSQKIDTAQKEANMNVKENNNDN